MSTNILGDIKFSVWIKEAREKVGLSHSGVEKVSNKGISKAYVGHLETETIKPMDVTLKKLVALAIAIKVSPIELLSKALESESEKIININNGIEIKPKSKPKILIEKSNKTQKKAG